MKELLQDCKSIEDVVMLINGGGTSHAYPETIAMNYALDALEEEIRMNFDDVSIGQPLSKDLAEQDRIDICSAHIDLLVEAGAKFDYKKLVKTFFRDGKMNLN